MRLADDRCSRSAQGATLESEPSLDPYLTLKRGASSTRSPSNSARGCEQGLRRVPPQGVGVLESALNDDERAQARGEAPRSQAIVSAAPAVPAAYRTKDAIDFYLQPLGPGRWENVVTTRSTRLARMYELGVWVSRIAPTPLLMVVATYDTITLSDLALEAYERAHEPKKLVTIPGDHFDPYLSGFDVSSRAATAWFREHLMR